MTEHDFLRKEKAEKCNINNRELLIEAITGLQSTDDPSLVPLHDKLIIILNNLINNEKLVGKIINLKNTSKSKNS